MSVRTMNFHSVNTGLFGSDSAFGITVDQLLDILFRKVIDIVDCISSAGLELSGMKLAE